MKKLIAITMLLFSAESNAQVIKEPDLSYTNNYFKEEVYKALKDKPDNLKYEVNGNLINLTHQSKGIDIYASSDLFPRSDFHHYIRDFNMSFDFSFSQTADPDNFLGISFLISPNEDIDWKDSASFVYFIISAEGNLYSFAKDVPYDSRICYTCPPLLKEKDVKKLYNLDNIKAEQIPGFSSGAKNSLVLNRTNDKWELSINGKKIKEFNAMAKGYFSSRMGPIFVLKGKSSIQLENLLENYGHQNSSVLSYLKSMSTSGFADLSGACIKGKTRVIYELTTQRGTPSVKISWKNAVLNNRTDWVYFDFKEGLNYGEYKHRGLSSLSFNLFDEPGEARNIKIKPDKGEISFDYYFLNRGSVRTTGAYTQYTSTYCNITISKID